jgi:hypothetical protein
MADMSSQNRFDVLFVESNETKTKKNFFNFTPEADEEEAALKALEEEAALKALVEAAEEEAAAEKEAAEKKAAEKEAAEKKAAEEEARKIRMAKLQQRLKKAIEEKEKFRSGNTTDIETSFQWLHVATKTLPDQTFPVQSVPAQQVLAQQVPAEEQVHYIPCSHPDCDKPALHNTGYCDEHTRKCWWDTRDTRCTSWNCTHGHQCRYPECNKELEAQFRFEYNMALCEGCFTKKNGECKDPECTEPRYGTSTMCETHTRPCKYQEEHRNCIRPICWAKHSCENQECKSMKLAAFNKRYGYVCGECDTSTMK